MTSRITDDALSRVVRLVAVLNLAYFGIEFAIARTIGSVSLFADSIDFLEDASVNFLILIAFGSTARERARVGMALAGILLVPGLAMLWTAWEKLSLPAAPDPALLSLTGAGALAVNMSCALMLTHYRRHSGSLTKAAFLSARNDAIVNIAIIAVGLVTAYTRSAWPDLIVGLGIATMNADAPREVWQAAREEHRTARPAGQGCVRQLRGERSLRCDSEKVATARRSLGLSQQELAHKANVARSAVERIEGGFLVYEPTIQQVAAALGLLVGDISHPDEQARSRDQPDTGAN
jgi:Co/Zn/Cd efflux system component